MGFEVLLRTDCVHVLPDAHIVKVFQGHGVFATWYPKFIERINEFVQIILKAGLYGVAPSVDCIFEVLFQNW